MEFEEIFEKYHRKIFYLLLSLTRNITDAEDLAQETFIKCYKKLNSFKEDSKLSTWLHRIAVNCWKNKVRYDKRRGIYKEESLDAMQDNLGADYAVKSQFKNAKDFSAENILEDSQLQQEIKKCVHSLSPKYKVPITLYMEGYSIDEISRIIKRRSGTVKSLIFRAKLMLKENIVKYTGTDGERFRCNQLNKTGV